MRALAMLASFAILGIAVRPPIWVIWALFVVFACAGALLGPARSTLYVHISPAHIRGVALNANVLAGLPATVIRILLAAWVFANYGNQGGLYMAVPFLFVAALIEISAAGFFERDMRAAISSQVASGEWRRAKEAGNAKLLVCRDVDVEYNGVQVLFEADFDVGEGEIVALLGTNGAGKSTMLKAIAGIQEASGGAVVVDGRDITHMPPNEIAKHGVVLMPGGKGTFPDLTVSENLAVANWLNDPETSAAKLEEVAEMFPVLKERWDERAQLLSGGEQQMLSLSMAFLSRPRLLMIDELSLGLAPSVVDQLIEVVRKINEQGATVIIVEQSVNVALAVAERAVFLEKGEVKFVGETKELLRRPDILRAVYVRGAAAVGGSRPDRRRRGRARSAVAEDSRVVLEVMGASKSFGGVAAVLDVDLALREGEALGLIGPNGAGKTTLFDLISGFVTPTTGSLAWDGKPFRPRPHRLVRQGIARTLQGVGLFEHLTALENVMVGAATTRQVGFASALFGLPRSDRDEARLRNEAGEWLERLGAAAVAGQPAGTLAFPMQKRVALARGLTPRPRLLMLDEPAGGLGAEDLEPLADLIVALPREGESPCSVILVEHHMDLVMKVCDEVVVLDFGKCVAAGTPAQVQADPAVAEAYLGAEPPEETDVTEEAAALSEEVRP
jgi:ABC-type branched-subunit amino acid transport system ATPase component